MSIYEGKFDTGDYVEILWGGGLTETSYIDHRDGGRVMIDHPDTGYTIMLTSEFGRMKLNSGMVSDKTRPMLPAIIELIKAGEVDDSTDSF